MSKDKIKQFVKEHKKDLIIGGCAAVCGGITALVGRQMIVRRSINWKEWDEFFEFINKCQVDAKQYLPIYGDDLHKVFGDTPEVKSGDGQLNKIVGAMLFTNVVEEASVD